MAAYLAHRLAGNVLINAVYGRNSSANYTWAKELDLTIVHSTSELPVSDLNIICVKDDVISQLASLLNPSIPVVHTSGTVSIQALSGHNQHGILYPLQTISKERISHLGKFPFLVEANQVDFESRLLNFALTHLSPQSIITDSKSRAKIHLAAVFGNNFSNYFLVKAKEVMDESHLDFQLLKPLLLETIEKAFTVYPENAQTGPAKRNDISVIQKQADSIADAELKDVYLKISALISKQFNSL